MSLRMTVPCISEIMHWAHERSGKYGGREVEVGHACQYGRGIWPGDAHGSQHGGDVDRMGATVEFEGLKGMVGVR